MNEQQLAAVKQALGALTVLLDEWTPARQAQLKGMEAVTALQSIISQDALDKKAENARELGLSYDDEPKIGCVNHDCDKCKAVQEPVAWVDLLKQAEEVVRSKSLWKKYIDGTPLANDIAVWMASFAQEHATPPAAQPALPPMHASGLVAIKTLLSRDPCAHAKVAIEMIDAMLVAEPQPVPVKTYHDGKPWPVAPKPWVGLTDEEMQVIEDNCLEGGSFWDVYRTIEAKLKGKNHDQ